MCLIATEFPVVHLEWTRIGEARGGREEKQHKKEAEHCSENTEQINRLSTTQVEHAGQTTHSSQTNLCSPPSSESLLSGNTGIPLQHAVP